jgi:hypothetical protein
MATSHSGKTAFWALTLTFSALAASCDEAPRIGALWTAARNAGRTADAAAAPNTDAPADAGADGGLDGGSNAFFRQKPQPLGLITEYAFKRDRFAALHTTEKDVGLFLDGLKTALRNKNRDAIANAANYPLVVAIGRGQMVVDDREQFLARYDDIMTTPVASAIRNANAGNVQVHAQGITLGGGANRLASYTGMSVGNGRVWFDLAEVNAPPAARYRMLVRMVNATAPGRSRAPASQPAP